MRSGLKPRSASACHDFRVTLDAVGSEFAERIVGPARIAVLTGPGVSCDVEEHGSEAEINHRDTENTEELNTKEPQMHADKR